jgi:hypothetical protein
MNSLASDLLVDALRLPKMNTLAVNFHIAVVGRPS